MKNIDDKSQSDVPIKVHPETHQIDDIYQEEEAKPLDYRNKQLRLFLYGSFVLIGVFILICFIIPIPYYFRLPVMILNTEFTEKGEAVITLFSAEAADPGGRIVSIELNGKPANSAVGEKNPEGLVTGIETNTEMSGYRIRVLITNRPSRHEFNLPAGNAVMVYPGGYRNFISYFFLR